MCENINQGWATNAITLDFLNNLLIYRFDDKTIQYKVMEK